MGQDAYYHEEDGGIPLKYDSQWEGVTPKSKRSCQNVVCGFIFLACLVANLVLTFVAYSKSDLDLIDDASSSEGFAHDIHFLQDQPGFLAVGIPCTLLLAFLWLEFLKRFTKCVVYTSLAAAVGVVILCGVLLLTEGKEACTIAGVIVFIIAFALLVMIFLARKKINFSCAVIGHACAAVQANLSIFTVIVPIMFVIVALCFVWWVATAVFLVSAKGSEYSCNTLTTESSCKSHACEVKHFDNGTLQCDGTTYNLDKQIRYSLLYLIFMVIWGLTFLSGLSKTTVAGTISSWYFTRNKENVPFLNSLRMHYWCWRFHFGSIALGSGLLAIVRFIQFLLEQAQRETDNKFVKIVLCIIRCWVACFAAMLKFITKYAYVYIAMHGEGFYTSCKKVQDLFTRSSFGTLFINDMVTHLIVRMGMVLSVGIVVFSSLLYMKHHGDGDISVATIVVLALFAAMTFKIVGNVVEIASDTVIVCYMEDEERNKGTEYMGGDVHAGIKNSLQVCQWRKS